MRAAPYTGDPIRSVESFKPASTSCNVKRMVVIGVQNLPRMVGVEVRQSHPDDRTRS